MISKYKAHRTKYTQDIIINNQTSKLCLVVDLPYYFSFMVSNAFAPFNSICIKTFRHSATCWACVNCSPHTHNIHKATALRFFCSLPLVLSAPHCCIRSVNHSVLCIQLHTINIPLHQKRYHSAERNFNFVISWPSHIESGFFVYYRYQFGDRERRKGHHQLWSQCGNRIIIWHIKSSMKGECVFQFCQSIIFIVQMIHRSRCALWQFVWSARIQKTIYSSESEQEIKWWRMWTFWINEDDTVILRVWNCSKHQIIDSYSS